MLLMSRATWPQIDEYLQKSSNPTVLVPLSPIEEHGPHLPTDTDIRITERGTEIAGERYDDCVIFRPIPLMCCGISKRTTGTYAIGGEALKGLIRDLVIEFQIKGFKRALFLSCHGGFSKMVAREAIKSCISQGVNIVAECLSFEDVFKPEPGLIETKHDLHAGEIETSVMLAICPELVGELPPADFHEFVDGKPTILSKSGICGDPQKASVAKGERIIEITVQGILDWLESH